MRSLATKLGGGLLALGALAVGCRGAEPFPLAFDGEGSGGETVIAPGTGGAVGSGGVPGSGGAGSGGAGSGGAGSGGDGSGGAGTGGAPVAVDAGQAADVGTVTAADAARDSAAAPDLSLDGPFALFNCEKVAVYKLDYPYRANDKVYSLRDLRVYQCKPGLESGWCTIGAYEPSGASGYWPNAWIPLGYCE